MRVIRNAMTLLLARMLVPLAYTYVVSRAAWAMSLLHVATTIKKDQNDHRNR